LRTHLVGEDEAAVDVEELPGQESAGRITVVDPMQPTPGNEVLGLNVETVTIEPDQRATGGRLGDRSQTGLLGRQCGRVGRRAATARGCLPPEVPDLDGLWQAPCLPEGRLLVVFVVSVSSEEQSHLDARVGVQTHPYQEGS